MSIFVAGIIRFCWCYHQQNNILTNTNSRPYNLLPSITLHCLGELLYENFMQSRELKFYADALAVSENYLNRCVSNVTNKPPKQHINELLINHSKVLLQNFAKDISEVAFELNFSHPSYFGRLFKQLTKLTPSGYRNVVLQDLSEQK